MSADKTQVGGDHYVSCAIQPIDYIEKNGLGFLEGCVLKRITRHNRSGGKGRQDIEKAIHELQLLLERRYAQEGSPVVPIGVGSLVTHALAKDAQVGEVISVTGDGWFYVRWSPQGATTKWRIVDLLPA